MGDQIGLRVFKQDQYKHSNPEGHCLGQFYKVLNVYDWAFFRLMLLWTTHLLYGFSLSTTPEMSQIVAPRTVALIAVSSIGPFLVLYVILASLACVTSCFFCILLVPVLYHRFSLFLVSHVFSVYYWVQFHDYFNYCSFI